MRFLAIVVLVLGLVPRVFAEGPSPDVKDWNGFYDVTKCIQCPDVVIEGGSNLKNFKWFALGSGKIEEQNRLPCALSDIWVGFSIATDSDDGTVHHGHNYMAGQCHWGFDEFITTTSTAYEYTSGLPNSSKQIKVSVRKTGPDAYEFYKYERNDTPSRGYPKEWEYRVEAKKRSSSVQPRS